MFLVLPKKVQELAHLEVALPACGLVNLCPCASAPAPRERQTRREAGAQSLRASLERRGSRVAEQSGRNLQRCSALRERARADVTSHQPSPRQTAASLISARGRMLALAGVLLLLLTSAKIAKR